MKKLPVFFLILLMPLVFAQQPMDEAVIRAEVFSFSVDAYNNTMIKLGVLDILEYNRDPYANYLNLTTKNLTLGYLWGHKNVNKSFPLIDRGYVIEGEIHYHYNFTSHSGHLYSYKIVCNQSSNYRNGTCIVECQSDEKLTERGCVPLNCSEHEYAYEHRCTELNCSSVQYAFNHSCVNLSCDSGEVAKNHTCVNFVCRYDQEMKDSKCIDLDCGFLKKPKNHRCVLNQWIVLFVLILIIIAFLPQNIWYSTYKRVVTKDTWALLFLVLSVSLVITLVFYLRMNLESPIIPGKLMYRNYNNGIYSHIIKNIPLDHQLSSAVLAIFTAISVVIVFFRILRRLGYTTRQVFFIISIMVFSPAFIFTYVFPNPDSIVLLLVLMGVLFLTKRKLFVILGSIFLVFSSFLNPIAAFIAVLTAAYFGFQRKKELLLLLIMFIPLLIFSVIRNLPVISESLALTTLITDFGAVSGLGVFNVILFIAGLLSTWSKKDKYWPAYTITILGMIFSYLTGINAIPYLNLVVCFFGGLGLISLVNTKWEFSVLRNLTILLLLCGLVFSEAAYISRVVQYEPDKYTVDALEHLNKSKMMTHYTYTPLVEYYGSKGFPQIDDNFQYEQNITEKVFYSRDYFASIELLNQSNISHIFITDDMKGGLVWEEENQGLLFIFRNNETFSRVYSNKGAEIWKFEP